MSMNTPCPFCGIPSNLQNPGFGNHFADQGNSSPRISTPDGDIQLPNGVNPDSFYRCTGCEIDFLDEELTIEEILPNLTFTRNVGNLLNYYYRDDPISTIMTNITTRLFKIPNSNDTFLSQAKFQNQIKFVIDHNNMRTSGTILKTRKNSYKMTMLEEFS